MAARILGALVGAGAAAFGVKVLKEKHESAAVLALYETLAKHQQLSDLTAEEVKAIGERYGVDLSVKCAPEMKGVYDTFIESNIPVKTPLT